MNPNILVPNSTADQRERLDIGCSPNRLTKDPFENGEFNSLCYAYPMSNLGFGFHNQGTYHCSTVIKSIVDTNRTMKQIDEIPSYINKTMVSLFITFSNEERNSLLLDFVRDATPERPITKEMFPYMRNALD
jgi:hypothetical protein